ncbi:HAMP domain-containing sensor histidine kinase [Fodinibius sp.]|uniref:PorY family sensor histidine kinase n=1 Tax=Fodinibius sp. TaxID=1872440 RepID=UPI002ACEBA87|nr:HAMP domain-containing sensor histidine kinase [Fodinibius sp.]
MKLITKFVLLYLVVTIIVLGIGGFVSYHIIKGELDNELKWRFLDRVERVTYLLEQGKNFESPVQDNDDTNLKIVALPNRVEPNVEIRDTLVWHDRLQQMEHNLKLVAHRNVDGTSYRITTYGALVESDDITEAVIQILLWILGLQVIGAVGVGFIVSNRLFKPFRKTLERIKNFRLQDKNPITAEETSVAEFDDLNKFVEQMTSKAITDYKNLKEFAENASHELQTPLSIIKGKLELLTETDLSPEQYQLVEDSQRSVKKLSRLSESLALLTKIENHEFTGTEEVNLSELIKDSIQSFDEFITLNGLTVEADVEDDVFVHMHPVLADILWTNLFQNAIKHNVEEGNIDISLNSQRLRISNTGNPLSSTPEELFRRFKKDNVNSKSIGLGLAIIKRIADQYHYTISYTCEDGWHTVTINLQN